MESCLSGVRMMEQDRGQETWTKTPCILGIDEAGRGPVLGPMVYACAYSPESVDLSTRAFADSKQLTTAQRDALLLDIKKADSQMGYAAEIMSAHFIGTHMLGKSRISLNVLAQESTYRIIQQVLDRGVKLTKVYVDTVGDSNSYQERLSRQFPSLQFTVCPKADSLYPIVSAASIVAKTMRDAALTQAVQDCGLPVGTAVGTGYPADPHTKAWLRGALHRLWGLEPAALARFSWETVNKLMVEGCIPMTWEADAEAEAGNAASNGPNGGGAGQQRLTFAGKRQADVLETSGLGRHSYFRARKLQRITAFF